MIVAIPSLKLLYYADATQEVEMTVKITGIKTIGSNKVGLLKTLKTPLRQTAIAIDKETPLAALENVCVVMAAPVFCSESRPSHLSPKLLPIIKYLKR